MIMTVSTCCSVGCTVTPTAVPTLSPGLTPRPGQPWAPVPSCLWTLWMNSDLRTPNSHGDYETIANLRLTYPFCEHPADIECRVAPTATQPNGTPYDVANQAGVTCDLNHGLVCLDSEQAGGEKCHDYQVRFYCVDACPTSYPPDYTGETPTPYPPGYTGKTPTAYPPDYTGPTPYVLPPGYTGETPTPYPPDYTGPTPYVYPPGYTGETPTAYPPWYTGETPTAHPPGHSGDTPTAYPPWYTGETPIPYPPGYTGQTPTHSPYTCVPKWTGWINVDTPSTGDGDRERMTDKEKQEFCPHGKVVEIECETIDGIGYFSSGEQLVCDVEQGLICKNEDNSPIDCSDYRVRYRCECSQLPPEVTTSQPPYYDCVEGWTVWLNNSPVTVNVPSANNRQDSALPAFDGDVENLTELPGYPTTCYKVLSSECRVASTRVDYRSTGQMVTCDKQGLRCQNDVNQVCQDYEIRFYCICE